jgi:hypothetical protein
VHGTGQGFRLLKKRLLYGDCQFDIGHKSYHPFYRQNRRMEY